LAALRRRLPRKSPNHTAHEGGSLHAGRVDGDLLVGVAAAFAPTGVGDPLRVVMGLADCDSVAFSMPGYQGSLYVFSRSGGEVRVSTKTNMHLRADALMN